MVVTPCEGARDQIEPSAKQPVLETTEPALQAQFCFLKLLFPLLSSSVSPVIAQHMESGCFVLF